MGIVAGNLGVLLLNRITHDGTTGMFPDVAPAYQNRSKLEVLMGPEIWPAVQNRTVLDFGCGKGDEAAELARRGAARVIGLDINPRWIETARQTAELQGVADRCTFATDWQEPVDVIISLDSFEHFADPAAILRRMSDLLKPGGRVLVSFGPTWFHPLGGHFYSVFPWSHLVFSENALIRWRSLYKTDGARSIEESGLNRMTIRRFKRLVADSPFDIEMFKAVPIRKLRPLHNALTREFTTAIVRSTLIKR